MDATSHTSLSLRRSLARALKHLFGSVKVHNADDHPNSPVDIIRRDDSQTSNLPRISVVSAFPDFNCVGIEADRLPDGRISPRLPFQARHCDQASQKALLPAKSLSHINLRGVYCNQPTSGSAHQASFRTLEPHDKSATGHVPSQKPKLVSKRSSLQIRRPESLHARFSNTGLDENPPPTSSNVPPPVIRRTRGSGNLRKCAKQRSLAANTEALTRVAEIGPSPSQGTDRDDSLRLVKHFASLCVIDILAPGCPVSAVSDDLRYVYDVKDRFVLNAQEMSQLSMDLSIGRDAQGNEVTYVLLFSHLISLDTDKNRFILVSAIDVSGYVRYAASDDQISESSQQSSAPDSFSDQSEASGASSTSLWLNEQTGRLADALLQGCSIDDRPCSATTTSREQVSDMTTGPDSNYSDLSDCSDDIWTSIAKEESLKARSGSNKCNPARQVSYKAGKQQEVKPPDPLPSESQSRVNYADEKVLGRFVESLQDLYSQYFLLACSPVDDEFYEIRYVSPAVHASGEYILDHLSHTSTDLMNDFRAHLALEERFRAMIRWGSEGRWKQLYCLPLIGPQPAPWMCFLVDKGVHIHW
jgi:hypothetical protein